MGTAGALGKKALDKLAGLRQLTEWYRTTSNWRSLYKYRRRRSQLPPIELRNGPVLYHGPYDSPLLLLNEVWVKRWYHLEAAPPADALMLDIGANVGAVSLYWANLSPSLRIHCYEPNPAAFQSLRSNVERNGLNSRITIFPEGVGRTSGSLKLWIDVPTDLSTAYSETSPSEGGRRIEVPVVSLDEVWRRLGEKEVWLLKVDTEGAEVDILEGASSRFFHVVQNAIIEYHDNIYPESLRRCQRVLEREGFSWRARHHPWQEGIIYAWRRA
jgi:FkbM family methyltransferase